MLALRRLVLSATEERTSGDFVFRSAGVPAASFDFAHRAAPTAQKSRQGTASAVPRIAHPQGF